MHTKRMEHAVRNLALLAAVVGFLGAGPAMTKEARTAGWITSCVRSDRTEISIPTLSTATDSLPASMAAVRDSTAEPSGIVVSSQTATGFSPPDRSGVSVWTPNPAVGAAVLR
jgi:hypothetical protein